MPNPDGACAGWPILMDLLLNVMAWWSAVAISFRFAH
jgi:hypothetical protein